jgi:hypothetical protein
MKETIMKTLVIHPKDKTTDFLKSIYHGRGYTVITGGCTKEDVGKAIDEHDHIIMMGHGTPQGLLAVGQFNGKPKPVVKAKPAMKPSEAIRQGNKPVTSKDVKDFYTPSEAKSLLDQLPDREPGCDDEDDWFSNRQVGGNRYGNYGGYSSYGGYSNYGGSSYKSLTTGYVIDDSMVDRLRGKRLTAIWCNADQFMEWNNLSGFYTGMFISDTSEATLIGTSDTEQWMVDESNYAFSAAMRDLIDTQNPHEVLKNVRRTYSKLAKRNAVAKYNMLRLYARDAVKAEVVAS